MTSRQGDAQQFQMLRSGYLLISLPPLPSPASVPPSITPISLPPSHGDNGNKVKVAILGSFFLTEFTTCEYGL